MPSDALQLTAAVHRSRVLRAESLRVDVDLVNRGDTPVRVPSLGMNNGALELVVRDDGGQELGAHPWADALRRLQDLKFDPDEAQIEELAPGETDGLTRDLMLLREPLPPGEYTLAARLHVGSKHVESEPVAFTVLPSRPGAWAVSTDGDPLGPYHLHAAWVDSIEGRAWIVQASTFRATPGVLHHLDRAIALDAPPVDGALFLSRGLGPQADHRVTLIRTDTEGLHWCTLAPAISGPEHTAPANGAERVLGTSWRTREATWALIGATGAEEVRALRLDHDGQATEVGRTTIPADAHIEFVVDAEDRPWCLALVDDGTGSRLDRLGFQGEDPITVLKARTRGVALCVNHDRGRTPVAAVVLEDDDPERLVSWALRGADLGEQIAGPSLPRAREGMHWSFAIGSHGGLHGLLHRPGREPLYADPYGELLEHPGLEGVTGPVSLVAGRKGHPFAAFLDAEGHVALLALEAPAAAGVAGVHTH